MRRLSRISCRSDIQLTHYAPPYSLCVFGNVGSKDTTESSASGFAEIGGYLPYEEIADSGGMSLNAMSIQSTGGTSGGSYTIDYTYRPDGLRHSKTVDGVKTTHIWNGANIVLELDDGGNVIDRYVRGMGLIKNGQNQWFHFNAHGDVVGLTNNSGDVTKTYRYDAFGVEINPDPNDKNPWRYCGEYLDLETNTYYLRARYYQPSTGRFLSEDTHWHSGNMIYGDNPRDPLGLNRYTPDITAIRQSGNLYVYCMGNPIRFVDPTGNSSRELVQIAGEIAMMDGPLPFADLVAAGVIVFAGGVWVWENREAIWNGMQWTGRAVGGWFQSKSGRVGWDVPDNTINHVLKGTNGSHKSGWQKFGLDPNDPKSFGPLLPFLKEAVDKGKETITKAPGGGRIIEYVYYIKDKAFEVWVRIYEYPDGRRILTDAAEAITK